MHPPFGNRSGSEREGEDRSSDLPFHLRSKPVLASRTASASRPLSVSSRIAKRGRSMASWRISARFISPPEKPSLT